MNRSFRFVVAFLFVLALVAPAWAAKEIGDPAPPLKIDAWAKGGPVTLSAGKGKNIYVIEFWATWCGPCRVSMPHLTELQHKYKDKGVVIIGISDEPESVVKPFVLQNGDKMDYIVAADDNVATGREYMAAFGIDGIPYAFVVDKNGAIAWHGHPAGGLDKVLEQMVAGKFDIEVAKQTAQANKLMEQYFGLIDKWNDAKPADRDAIAKQARQIGESILQKGARSSDLLNDFAWNIIMMPGTSYRDNDLAARATESAFKASEQKPADKNRKQVLEYLRAVQSVTDTQPVDAAKKEEMKKLGDAIVKDGEPVSLNDFAWTLLVAPDLATRDYELALHAAEAANKATGQKEPSILDTYALALFKTGKRDRAIEITKKAIELSDDPGMTAHLREMLSQYQNPDDSQADK